MNEPQARSIFNPAQITPFFRSAFYTRLQVLNNRAGRDRHCTITMALKQVVKLIAVTIFSCIYSTLVFISLFFRPKWLIGGFFKKSKSDHPPKCLSDPSLGTHGYIHLEVRNEAYLACVRQDSVFYIIKLKTLLILASLYKLQVFLQYADVVYVLLTISRLRWLYIKQVYEG